jgi:hypothetical protein
MTPARPFFSFALLILLCTSPWLHPQTWPQNGVTFSHNGSNYAYWLPTDAPAETPLRVIIRMRGAGSGIDRPSDFMSALTARNAHAVVVANSNSYSEIIAPELIQTLRAAPHNLDIKDDVFIVGNSRGGQGVNRLMQQIPEGIRAAFSSNPGNLTTPTGRLFGQFPSNQGGWTDEEIGPVFGGPPWSALNDDRKMALGDPAKPGFNNIAVMAHAGAADQARYPHSMFFAMEVQHLWQHPHFETYWGPGGHGMNTDDVATAIDFFLRVEAHPDNAAPQVQIAGPRIIVLNPGTTHTLTATATDAEDDDASLTMEWRKVSLINEPQFVQDDTLAYAARYIDGVDGWIPLHRYADVSVDGFNSTRASRTPRVLSSIHSLTFTVPTVPENTPMVFEAKAIDSAGFAGTDSVMVVVNAPPRILEGPESQWSTHKNSPRPMRFRALDIDSAALQWSIHEAPEHGSVDFLSSTGEFVDLTYTPASGYMGADSFVLRVTDALGLHSELTVSIDVTNDFLSLPAEMNAVRQRSTDAAGSLTSGSGMTVRTGSFPNWMNNRSAYFRFPLHPISGDYVSSQVRLFVHQRTKTAAEVITVYKVPENQNDGLAFAWGVVPPLSAYELVGTLPLAATGFVTFDTTDLVAQALADDETSLTLVFYADSGNGPIYASRHWPDPAQRPALEIVSLTGEPEAPAITEDPQDLLVTDGATAVFSAGVTGIPFPDLQWQLDGVDLTDDGRISGASTATLTIDPVQPGDAGTYRLVATNVEGSATSQPATLTVELLPPAILTHPQDTNSFIGAEVILSVEAAGSPPLTYTWFRNGVPIPQSNSPDLILSDLQAGDAGSYTVSITNATGQSATSAPALLTVGAPPALLIKIDFSATPPNAPANWNIIGVAAGGTFTGTFGNLLHFATGDPTPVAAVVATTQGSGLRDSSADNSWGLREVAPPWADPESHALNNRVFVVDNSSARITFTGLTPGAAYRLEIASSVGGNTAGDSAGKYTLSGGDGPVEGFNAHTGRSLGTEVLWTPRGPHPDEPRKPHSSAVNSEEGWLLWPQAVASEAGELILDLSTVGAGTSNPRIAVNALRLESLAASSPPEHPFNDWISQFNQLPPDQRAPLDTPAGDALPNLLKYALDLDPTLPATGTDRAVVDLVDEDGARVIELRVPEGLSRPALHYILETSGDLETWSPLAEAVGHTIFSATPGAPVATVIREGDVVSVTLTGEVPPRAFYRLTVTLLE